MYRSIFIDLDDTVWAFTENARDTFQDMYDKYHFDRYFRSFSHFYTLYSGKNEELWNEYGAGRITKDELNEARGVGVCRDGPLTIPSRLCRQPRRRR